MIPAAVRRAVVHAKSVALQVPVGTPVAQPFRAARAAICRPEGPRYNRPRLLVALTLMSILLTACAHHAAGVAYRPWELRGTIVTVHDDHVLVRHKSGQVVDLVVDDRTTIIGSEGRATLSVLTRGRRVVVHVEPLVDGRSRAARVQAFGT